MQTLPEEPTYEYKMVVAFLLYFSSTEEVYFLFFPNTFGNIVGHKWAQGSIMI